MPKKKLEELPIPEVDETKFVCEMYSGRLIIDYYDPEFLVEVARHLKEQFPNKFSEKTLRVFNCHSTDGIIDSHEPLTY